MPNIPDPVVSNVGSSPTPPDHASAERLTQIIAALSAKGPGVDVDVIHRRVVIRDHGPTLAMSLGSARMLTSCARQGAAIILCDAGVPGVRLAMLELHGWAYFEAV